MLPFSFTHCSAPLYYLRTALPLLTIFRLVPCQSISSSNSTFSKGAIRYYPTLDEVLGQLKPGYPPPDRALLWTKLPGGDSKVYREIRWRMYDFSERYGLSPCEDKNAWRDWRFWIHTQYQGTAFERDQWLEDIFSQWAAQAVGRVYLLMPYYEAPDSRRWFWNTEWPALRDNQLVDEIVWLDASVLWYNDPLPDPFAVTKVWWKRGMEEPVTRPDRDPMSMREMYIREGWQINYSRPRGVQQDSMLVPSPTASPTKKGWRWWWKKKKTRSYTAGATSTSTKTTEPEHRTKFG